MLTLPTVFNDALSYNEQVCKLTEALNQQGEIIKGLPEYIEQIVKELLEQAGLEDIVKQVLADYLFIDVKNPPAPLVPAVGDGVADDTVAIQAMIDYVTGKSNYLFFPAGTYSVQGLNMVPGISLIGLNRYNTTIMLRPSSNKDLLIGDLGQCTISNVTLNANMPGQTANCSVFAGNVTDMLVSDVILKNGYNVLSIDCDGIVQMDNIVIDGTQGNGLSIGGVRAMIKGITFTKNSTLNAGTLITITGENNMLSDVLNTEYAVNGIIINGNNNSIKGWMSGTATAITNNGTNNEIQVYTGTDLISNVSNVNETITGYKHQNITSNKDETITGNKGVTVSGNETKKITGTSNVSTGEKIENINGNSTKTITGSSAKTVTVNDTETITETKEIKANQIFLNPVEPLKYGEVVDNTVSFQDKNGNIYNLLTDKVNLEGEVLYNDFYIDGIVKHDPDWFTDSDDLKAYTSDQFYSLWDGIQNSGLIKTSIGTDNEGKTIYAYKHTAYIKSGLNLSALIANRIDSKAILIVSGQHGTEKSVILTLYRWYVDEMSKPYSYVLNNYDICIVPCMSPTNIDTNSYFNANGVNPNRNFPIGFTPSATSGQTALDQKQCEAFYNYMMSRIAEYGTSLMVFNLHNSNYYEHTADGESRVIWYNANSNAVDMKYFNNLLKGSQKIKTDILKVYPDLNGNGFIRFLATVSDGTLGGTVAGTGCRFVLCESPMRFTETGPWFSQRTGYINYLIMYNTFKICFADEYYAPYLVRFNRLAQIGCSSANTIVEICNALPATCELSVLVSPSGTTLSQGLPPRNIYAGILSVAKEYESDRCTLRFQVADGSRNSIEWCASYDTDYGMSTWTPSFAEMSNANINMNTATIESIFNQIGNSAVLRVISSHPLYSILPVASAGMLFVYSPILPSDFVNRIKICMFVSDNGGFYINNNNVPTSDNWITVKAPA